MPLSPLAGFSRGISEGLANIAAIKRLQGMDQDRELALKREARAEAADTRAAAAEGRAATEAGQRTELFNQQQKKWHEENDPYMSPREVLTTFGFPKEDAAAIEGRLGMYGVKDPNAKLSRNQIGVLSEQLRKDPEVSDLIHGHGLKLRNQQIADIETDMKTLEAAGRAGTLEYKNLERAKKEAEARRQMNPLFKAQQEREDKENPTVKTWQEAEGMYQKTGNEKYRQLAETLYTKEKGLREREVKGDTNVTTFEAYRTGKKALGWTEDKIATEWEKYKSSLNEREARAGGGKNGYAPSDTEKKFNFWKRLYPNLSDEEIEKKVIKEDIPSEARYVLDYIREAQKNGDDVAEAEKSARELYRKVTGGKEPPPAPGAGSGMPEGAKQAADGNWYVPLPGGGWGKVKAKETPKPKPKETSKSGGLLGVAEANAATNPSPARTPTPAEETMVPGYSPRQWKAMTPAQKKKAREDYVAQRKARYFGK